MRDGAAAAGVPRQSPAATARRLPGLALVAAGLASVPLGGTAQLAFAAFAILLVGLPHGASDHLVVLRAGPGRIGRFVGFLAVYLGAVAATVALWLAWPALGLTLFLALSVVHFGIDDLPDEAPGAHGWERLARGLAPVTLPALLHRDDLARLHGLLSDPDWGMGLATVSRAAAPVVLAVGLWAVMRRLGEGRRDRAGELALTGAALVLLPPLVGFGLYFALVHSRGQTKARMDALGFRRLHAYLRASAPTLAGAALVFAALTAAFTLGHAPPLVPLFVGLSALTVPHMLVTPLFAPGPR